jgi:3-hydroxymyristoyl/3-hydroxydecanoyl-(acyl carrier protein) dehydratase
MMVVTEPEIIERKEIAPQTIELLFTVPPNLKYFAGHFPNAPVVAGVVQVKWAIDLGAQCFAIEKRVAALEVIKFRKLMLPNELITLRLGLDSTRRKLHFSFESDSGVHSSGRIVMERTP